MSNAQKATKILSGLVILASILLLIDYYLPPQKKLLVIEVREDKGRYSGHRYHSYGYAEGIKISENNFPCIGLTVGDTLILTRSAIHKIQQHIVCIGGTFKGANCVAEFNTFGLRGIFLLLPLLLALTAIRVKDEATALFTVTVALSIYLMVICVHFVL